MPGVSAPAKVERLRAQGATINVVGDLYDDAQAACDVRAAETGALNKDLGAHFRLGRFNERKLTGDRGASSSCKVQQ